MPGTRRLTIALAGSAGSGKSTTAHALAKRLGGNVVSFGDYVRHLAGTTERTRLQSEGQQRVSADPSAFTQAFLEWADPSPSLPLIIDGVRHAAVDQALRSWSAAVGSDYALILIDTPIDERARRRHGGDQAETRKVDDHAVEREISSELPRIAEVIVDGCGTIDVVLRRIVAGAPAELASRLVS